MKTAVRERVSRKSFMDYAIWIDFPVNAAILAYFVMKIREAFRTGIDVALETGFGIDTGSDALDMFAAIAIPALGLLIPLSLVTELIFIIIKLQGKQPYLTEKYSFFYIIDKIFLAVIAVLAIIIF